MKKQKDVVKLNIRASYLTFINIKWNFKALLWKKKKKQKCQRFKLCIVWNDDMLYHGVQAQGITSKLEIIMLSN